MAGKTLGHQTFGWFLMPAQANAMTPAYRSIPKRHCIPLDSTFVCYMATHGLERMQLGLLALIQSASRASR